MEKINIEGTDDTPKVVIDSEAGVFMISGRSLPEDVITFYQPIMNWLDSYSLKTPLKLDVKLEYFNTASSKIILDILLKLEELSEKSITTSINWHYDANDEDMQEAGEEFSEMVNVPFELIKY